MTDETLYRVISLGGRLYVEKCCRYDGGEKYTDWCKARDRVVELLREQQDRAQQAIDDIHNELQRVAKWTGP